MLKRTEVWQGVGEHSKGRSSVSTLPPDTREGCVGWEWKPQKRCVEMRVVGAQVSWVYWVGSKFFLAGCYLALVEIINGNLQLDAPKLVEGATDAETGRPIPQHAVVDEAENEYFALIQAAHHTDEQAEAVAAHVAARHSGALQHKLHRGQKAVAARAEAVKQRRVGMRSCLGKLRWWAWQPQSHVYLGTLTQLVGALLFEVGCTCGLPIVLGTFNSKSDHDSEWTEERIAEWTLVYTTSFLGGVAFTIASYVGLIEVTHSANPFRPPPEPSLGYLVALCNLYGSALFMIAAAFYYVEDGLESWTIKQYAVKLPYNVGSVLFVVGACFGVAEVLNE